MPTVVEVMTYTLEELKTLESNPYEQAIENVLVWWNEGGDWCQWLTEDINNWFKDGPGKFEEGESPFDSGKMEEWDADHRTVSYTWSVDALAYMKRNRLHLTLRTLYNWLKDGWDTSLGGKAGTGVTDRDRSPYFSWEVDEDLRRGFGSCEDEKRQARLEAQGDVLISELKGDVERVTAKLKKWVVDEMEYRYSEEFAVEEAAEREMKFTESGKIFHKPR